MAEFSEGGVKFKPGTGVLLRTESLALFVSAGVREGAELVTQIRAGLGADGLIQTIQGLPAELADFVLLDFGGRRMIDQTGQLRPVCQILDGVIRSGKPVDLLSPYELTLGIVPADGVEMAGWQVVEVETGSSQSTPVDGALFPESVRGSGPAAARNSSESLPFDPFADPPGVDLERVGEHAALPEPAEAKVAGAIGQVDPRTTPETHEPQPPPPPPVVNQPPPPPPLVSAQPVADPPSSGASVDADVDRTVVEFGGAFSLDSVPHSSSSGKYSMMLAFDDGRSVHATGPVIVGRKPTHGEENVENETLVIVDDESVSRRHLTLWPEEAGVFVKDLGSLNGTYIGSNSQPDVQLTPNKPEVLRPGSTVSYGERSFTLQEE